MSPRIPKAGRVSYERQTLAHPNPLARFAHRRRLDLALALTSRYLPPGGTVLDFGAGTGDFLHRFGQKRPDGRLLAFEPFMALRHPDIRRIPDLSAVPDASLALVTAFEVCEHLAPDALDAFLAETRRLLGPGGHLVVSVPIMEGLALPLKEAARALLFRRAGDYRAMDLVRGTFGIAVPRADNILVSHKGFAHRDLWRRLRRNFTVVEARLSPFAALPWWMNSQCFGVFAPHGTTSVPPEHARHP